MKLNQFLLAVAAVGLAAGPMQAIPGAQASRSANVVNKNPFEGNPDAIQAGMSQFRVRCSDCHGMDARGTRGPDLTQVWASGRTDPGLFRTIRNGVPGTEMPAINVRSSDDDVWRILAYLRTLGVSSPSGPPRGNAQNGERVFRATCSGCHRIDGRGGRLGPDLSRITSTRGRAALVRRIRGAVEEHGDGYEPVTLTTPSGQQIQAVKKNEDLFSIQVMDTRERIQGYLKEDIKEVKQERQSRMPTYDINRLSESDLDDVLAYFATLKRSDPSEK